MPARGTYIIHLDGSWSLEDLYKFPRAYEQVYFFIQAVETGGKYYEGNDLDYIFQAFPWQGGYSAVSFYNSLKYRTQANRRPEIISIHYASPGWLELGVILAVALNVEKIVKATAKSIEHLNETYNYIIKGMQDRKLRSIKIEREQIRLNREQLKFINESSNTMCKLMGLKNLSDLNDKTGSPLISLKMILSLYRRVRILADYHQEGKAEFTNSRTSEDDK